MAVSEKRKAYHKEWQEKNREKRNVYLAEWRANNRDKTSAANKRWYEKNHEEILEKARKKNPGRAEYYKEWRRKNREKYRTYHREYYHNKEDRKAQCLAAVRKRQTKKLFATPSWLTKNHFKKMENIYIKASKLKLTVDHIVPLQGVLVCGLHVPWNLQLLTLSENVIKGNKFNV